jgi:hypothetical protein
MSFRELQAAQQLDGSRQQGSGNYLKKKIQNKGMSRHKNTNKSTRGLQETYIAIAHMRTQEFQQEKSRTLRDEQSSPSGQTPDFQEKTPALSS